MTCPRNFFSPMQCPRKFYELSMYCAMSKKIHEPCPWIFFSLMSCSDFFIKSIQTQNILQHSILSKHSFLPFKHSFFSSFLYRNGIFSWLEIFPNRKRSNWELYTAGNGDTGNGLTEIGPLPREGIVPRYGWPKKRDRTANGVPSLTLSSWIIVIVTLK